MSLIEGKSDKGGAVALYGGRAYSQFVNTAFLANRADVGPAVYNEGSFTCINCHFLDNTELSTNATMASANKACRLSASDIVQS